MKRISSTLLALGLILAFAAPAFAYQAFKGPLGVLQNNTGALDGYILIAPQDGKVTYLIDKDGNVINEWVSEHTAFYAELLPNGNMARHSRPDGWWPNFGGGAGLLEEFNWEGEIVWSYQAYDEGSFISHHTFEVMPNGDYLLLMWRYKTTDEAIAKGMDPNFGGRTVSDAGVRVGGVMVAGIWPDSVIQVNHDKEIVWEWHVWDRTGAVDDYHAWNINKFDPPAHSATFAGPDWTHFNGIAYNPRNNKVTMTSRNLGEVYVIDYATGDLEYRWGNPYNWGGGRMSEGYGDNGDQKLFGPHAPDWTVEGYITILDNGNQRPNQVGTGFVELSYETDTVVKEWYASNVGANRSNYYSAYQSGVNKMPNGSYLITASTGSHILEIGADGSILWEYANPWNRDVMYATSSGHGQNGGQIHRAMFYAPDWSGFAGKDMSPRYSVPNWVELLRMDSVPKAAPR